MNCTDPDERFLCWWGTTFLSQGLRIRTRQGGVPSGMILVLAKMDETEQKYQLTLSTMMI